MKFKDLEVGDRFTMSTWQQGVVSEKIEPYKVFSPNGDGRFFYATEKEVNPNTGITSGIVKDNDEVIKL